MPAAFLAPAVIYMIAMFAYPIYYNILMSLTDFRVATFLTGKAPFVGFHELLDLFHNRPFFAALGTTGVFTAFSIAGQMTIGMSLALFFWRRFPFDCGHAGAAAGARGCCPSSFRRRCGSGCTRRTTASSTMRWSTLGITAVKNPVARAAGNRAHRRDRHQHLDRRAVLDGGLPFRPCRRCRARCSRRRSSTAPASCSASSSSSCRCSGR